MLHTRWRRGLATAAASLLLLLPAAPAHAQFTVITSGDNGASIITASDITASNGMLRFGGTVQGIDTDSVHVLGSGGSMRIPMRLARFEIDGINTDPTRLQAGQSVVVKVGSLHGNVIGVNGGIARVAVDGDTIDVPAAAFSRPVVSTRPVVVTRVAAVQPALLHVPYMVMSGTILDVQPDFIGVDMDGTRVQLPSAWPVHYRVNGIAVEPRDLHVGSYVTMGVGPFNGAIRSVSNNVVVIDTDQGGMPLALPVAVLPTDFSGTALVWVRDADGNLSRVPLSTALYMQQQGTASIESSTQLAVPPEDLDR